MLLCLLLVSNMISSLSTLPASGTLLTGRSSHSTCQRCLVVAPSTLWLAVPEYAETTRLSQENRWNHQVREFCPSISQVIKDLTTDSQIMLPLKGQILGPLQQWQEKESWGLPGLPIRTSISLLLYNPVNIIHLTLLYVIEINTSAFSKGNPSHVWIGHIEKVFWIYISIIAMGQNTGNIWTSILCIYITMLALMRNTKLLKGLLFTMSTPFTLSCNRKRLSSNKNMVGPNKKNQKTSKEQSKEEISSRSKQGSHILD